jgi:hypothetical protein
LPLPFVNKGFEINPGLESTFPWLSQVAQNFEEYSLKQLIFTYKSTIQDVNSANGQVGTVVTATQYNPSRPDFTSKMVMMEYAHAHTTKAVDTNIHGVEADPTKLSGSEGKYVRAGDVPVNEDIKTYDLGRFQIAVCGTPPVLADLPIGELWVDYTVELRKPKLYSGLGKGISTFRVTHLTYDDSNSDQRCPLGNTEDASLVPVVDCTNTLPVRLISSNTSDGTILELPDNFASYFKVTISIDIQSENVSGQYDWYRIQAPALTGNIEAVSDMVHNKRGSQSAPLIETNYGYVENPAVMAAGNNSNLGLQFIAHYRAQPASAGVKNRLSWGTDRSSIFDGNTGNIMVWAHAAASASGFNGANSGMTLSAGRITYASLEIEEYLSPLQNGDSVPRFKNLSGLPVEIVH